MKADRLACLGTIVGETSRYRSLTLPTLKGKAQSCEIAHRCQKPESRISGILGGQRLRVVDVALPTGFRSERASDMGKKNPHAVALGRNGAKARAAKLMKEELSEQGRYAVPARWAEDAVEGQA